MLISRDYDKELVDQRITKYFARTLLGDLFVHQIDNMLGTPQEFRQKTSDERAEIFDEIMTLYSRAQGYGEDFDQKLKNVMEYCKMGKLVEELFSTLQISETSA